MRPKLFLLELTSAVEEYAKKQGAMYKPDVGWFFVGSFLPVELEELEKKAPRTPGSVRTRQCPRCGGQMQLRLSRQGKEFWGCMSFPRCRGHADADEDSLMRLKLVSPLPKMDQKELTKLIFLVWKIMELQKEIEGWFAIRQYLSKDRAPSEIFSDTGDAEIFFQLLEILTE